MNLTGLKSKSVRAGLKANALHWAFVDRGVYLGYRRGRRGAAWYGRHGATVRQIGIADDALPANGGTVLDFSQALAKLKTQFAAEPGGKRAVVTVGDAFDAYARSYEAAGGRSKREHYKVKFTPLLDIKLAKLTKEDIEDWRQKLIETPPRARVKEGEEQKYRAMPDTEEARRKRMASVRQDFSVLKAALNQAFREGHVTSNRAWTTVRRLKPPEKPERSYLRSGEEVRIFVNACDEPSGFRNLFLGALLTGARVSELARLNIADYHADQKTLTIKTSKTGKPRHVPLTIEADQFFAALAAGHPPTDPLLPKIVRGQRRRWYASAQGPFIRAARQAVNMPDISFHSSRHTHISHLLMRHVAKEAIAKIVGHENTLQIENCYGHVSDKWVREQLDQSGLTFGIKPPATNVSALRSAKGR
jgi:integrase